MKFTQMRKRMKMTDVDDDSGAVDLTHSFWRFVSTVCSMPYDDMLDTPEYTLLNEYAQSGKEAFVLEGAVVPYLGPPVAVLDAHTDNDTDVDTDVDVDVDLDLEKDLDLRKGVRYDSERRGYVFANCNTLFIGMLDLLRRCESSAEPARLAMLEKCVRRMRTTADVSDLALDISSLSGRFTV